MADFDNMIIQEETLMGPDETMMMPPEMVQGGLNQEEIGGGGEMSANIVLVAEAEDPQQEQLETMELEEIALPPSPPPPPPPPPVQTVAPIEQQQQQPQQQEPQPQMQPMTPTVMIQEPPIQAPPPVTFQPVFQAQPQQIYQQPQQPQLPPSQVMVPRGGAGNIVYTNGGNPGNIPTTQLAISGAAQPRTRKTSTVWKSQPASQGQEPVTVIIDQPDEEEPGQSSGEPPAPPSYDQQWGDQPVQLGLFQASQASLRTNGSWTSLQQPEKEPPPEIKEKPLKDPKTYLGLAFFGCFFCCNWPCGVIAICLSCLADDDFVTGNRKAGSCKAGTSCALSIITILMGLGIIGTLVAGFVFGAIPL